MKKLIVDIDFKKVFSMDEFKKTLTRVENVATLALLISLFLPMRRFKSGFEVFTGDVPVFLFIPITAVLILAMRPTCDSAKLMRFAKIALGGFITFFFTIGLITLPSYHSIAFGFYAIWMSGIFILLGTFNIVQFKNAASPIREDIVEKDK